jgi:hypothetical protein
MSIFQAFMLGAMAAWAPSLITFALASTADGI